MQFVFMDHTFNRADKCLAWQYPLEQIIKVNDSCAYQRINAVRRIITFCNEKTLVAMSITCSKFIAIFFKLETKKSNIKLF